MGEKEKGKTRQAGPRREIAIDRCPSFADRPFKSPLGPTLGSRLQVVGTVYSRVVQWSLATWLRTSSTLLAFSLSARLPLLLLGHCIYFSLVEVADVSCTLRIHPASRCEAA